MIASFPVATALLPHVPGAQSLGAVVALGAAANRQTNGMIGSQLHVQIKTSSCVVNELVVAPVKDPAGGPNWAMAGLLRLVTGRPTRNFAQALQMAAGLRAGTVRDNMGRETGKAPPAGSNLILGFRLETSQPAVDRVCRVNSVCEA